MKYTAFIILAAAALLSACTQKAVVAPAPPVTQAPAPPSAQDLFTAAEQRFGKHEFAGAIAAYEDFMRAYPDSEMVPAALMKTGAAYRDLGDFARARSAYETVIVNYPGHYHVQEAWVEVLAAYYYEGRFDVVISKLATVSAAVTDDNLRLRIDLLAGNAYMALDLPSEAVLAYARAFQRGEDRVRDELRQRLSSALRLLDRDTLDRMLPEIADPDLRHMVSQLGRSLIYRRTTIGCLLPLSGAYQVFGQRALNGIELAMAEASAKNGSVEIIVRDTGGEDRQAAAAAGELIEAGVAAIVGPLVTADTVAEAAQAAGIPIVTLTQREGVTIRGDYVFRNFITPRMQTEAVVTHAVQRLGARRFAILYPLDTYGKTFMNLFWDEIISQGATVAAVAAYDGEQTDFAHSIKLLVGLEPGIDEELARELRPTLPTGLDRLPFSDFAGDLMGLYSVLPEAFYPPAPDPAGALAPSLLWETAAPSEETEPVSIVDFDAVFIPDAPRTAGLIIPQLAYFDATEPVLLGTNLWHSEALIEMSRRYVQGAIFPDGFFPSSQRPSVRRFVAVYQSIYDETPGFIEAVSYDASRLLLEIVARPSVRSRDSIRDALLRTADFPGATGVTAFDYGGEARKTPFLLTIRGSRLVEIVPPPADSDEAAEENMPDPATAEAPL